MRLIGQFTSILEGITDPNLFYLHVSLAPIRIVLHWSGANLYVEIKGSDPLNIKSNCYDHEKVEQLCGYTRKIHGPLPGDKDFQSALKAYLDDQMYIVSLQIHI